MINVNPKALKALSYYWSVTEHTDSILPIICSLITPATRYDIIICSRFIFVIDSHLVVAFDQTVYMV